MKHDLPWIQAVHYRVSKIYLINILIYHYHKEKVGMCRNSAAQTKNKIRFEFSSKQLRGNKIRFQLKILNELNNVFIFILKKLKKTSLIFLNFLKIYEFLIKRKTWSNGISNERDKVIKKKKGKKRENWGLNSGVRACLFSCLKRYF